MSLNEIRSNTETYDDGVEHVYDSFKDEHSQYVYETHSREFTSLVLGWLLAAAKPEDVHKAVENAHRVMGISR